MMKALMAVLLSGAISAATAATPGPVPELAKMPLGATWSALSAKVGAQDVSCSPVSGTPGVDSVCKFTLPSGAALAGMPLKPAGNVLLLDGKVVIVWMSLPPVAQSDREAVLDKLERQATTWHMTGQAGPGEVMFSTADFAHPPSTDAARQAVMASPSFWVKLHPDNSLAVVLGPLERLMAISELTQR